MYQTGQEDGSEAGAEVDGDCGGDTGGAVGSVDPGVEFVGVVVEDKGGSEPVPEVVVILLFVP